MMTEPILKATNLKKVFRQPTDVEVLKSIDLEVHPGETVAIMGASGEGKSTLLQILGTLEAATSGTLEIGGQPVTPRRADKIRSQVIGFVFQAFFLLEDSSAVDNVLMPGRIARKKGLRKRAEELLEKVDLSHRKDFPTKLLSGGEKQRVAIARALFNNPGLILADEPSGNLDHSTSDKIHDLLFDVVRSEGRALIAVTHDQALADLCDRVFTLRSGVLVPGA